VIAVLGLGLIGGSVLRGLAGPPAAGIEGGASAVGWDPDPAVRAAARSAGLAVADDVGALGAPGCVVVCAPPRATAGAVRDALDRWPEAVVFDTASVKRPVAEALRGADAGRVLLSHPLAGSEAGGFGGSQASLFAGAVWAACPVDGTPVALLADLSALTDRLGAALTVLSPAEHDRLLARTSHAPHLIASALAAGALRDEPLAAVASGGALRDMTRVAAADPALWREILELNGDEVRAALDDFRARLDAPDWAAGRAAVAALQRRRWSPAERRPVRHPLAAGWAPWLEGAAAGRTYTGVRRDRDALTASA